jgi:hypothetical protein
MRRIELHASIQLSVVFGRKWRLAGMLVSAENIRHCALLRFFMNGVVSFGYGSSSKLFFGAMSETSFFSNESLGNPFKGLA